MGLLTWITLGIIILAILGLGWQTFFSGVLKGARKIGLNPVIKNFTNEAKEGAKQMIGNITRNS
jgi:hypothetical protein